MTGELKRCQRKVPLHRPGREHLHHQPGQPKGRMLKQHPLDNARLEQQEDLLHDPVKQQVTHDIFHHTLFMNVLPHAINFLNCLQGHDLIHSKGCSLPLILPRHPGRPPLQGPQQRNRTTGLHHQGQRQEALWGQLLLIQGLLQQWRQHQQLELGQRDVLHLSQEH